MQTTSKRKWHLSQEERVEISYGLRDKQWFREIWRRIKRNHSVVKREVERNSLDLWRGKTKYDPIVAHRMAQERRYKANYEHIILRRDVRQRKILVGLLKRKGYIRGPDEILWRLREKCWYKVISIWTFYRFIREEMPELQKYLRYKKRWYRTRKKGNKRKKWYDDMPNIRERPKEADNREEVWHREWDTLVSNRQTKWWAVTVVDRKSR